MTMNSEWKKTLTAALRTGVVTLIAFEMPLFLDLLENMKPDLGQVLKRAALSGLAIFIRAAWGYIQYHLPRSGNTTPPTGGGAHSGNK